MTRRITIAAGCLLVVCLVAQSALAQGRGRGFGGFTVTSAQLLGLKEVQSDLDLNADQIAKAAEINEAYGNQVREIFQANRDNREEARTKMAAAREEASKKTMALLNESQQKRLGEIELQVLGTAALSRPNVREALKIDRDQLTKLREVGQANGEAAREALQDVPREERGERMAALRAEGDKKLMAVLTGEQREQFEKMKGKKLEIDRSQLRGRGRGRGRRNSDNNN